MRAVVFDEGAAVAVTEVPDPLVEPDDVLLQVEAAGICHTDLDILHGRYPAELPVVPGHEFVGTVCQVGPRVRSVEVGTRVAVDPLRTCGTCRSCVAGRRNLCRYLQAYGADLDGGLAELAVVDAGNVHPIGDLTATVAALAEPLSCANHGISRVAPGPSDRVLLFGSGPVGLLLATALRGWGINDLTVVDRFPERLAAARRFGATTVEVAGPDLDERVPRREFDLVIEATGQLDVAAEAVSYCHDGGTVLLFGVCPPGRTMPVQPNEIYARELRLIGSFSLNGDIPAGIKLLQTTPLPVAELVTDVFGLDHADRAVQRVGTAGALKVQVVP